MNRAHISLAAAVLYLPSLLAEVRLSGRVVNENFIPVSAVRITLAEKSKPAARFTTSSDNAGSFSLTLPAAGEYSMQAERAGYFRVFASRGQGKGEASSIVGGRCEAGCGRGFFRERDAHGADRDEIFVHDTAAQAHLRLE